MKLDPDSRSFSTPSSNGQFVPRRSYARARASRERVEAIARVDRNKKSQEKTVRVLRIVVNVVCGLGIIALLIYAIFFAPKGAVNPIDKPVFTSE